MPRSTRRVKKRRMARRPKPVEHRRDAQIQVKLTVAERARLDAAWQAEKAPDLSSWARAVLFREADAILGKPRSGTGGA